MSEGRGGPAPNGRCVLPGLLPRPRPRGACAVRTPGVCLQDCGGCCRTLEPIPHPHPAPGWTLGFWGSEWTHTAGVLLTSLCLVTALP